MAIKSSLDNPAMAPTYLGSSAFTLTGAFTRAVHRTGVTGQAATRDRKSLPRAVPRSWSALTATSSDPGQPFALDGVEMKSPVFLGSDERRHQLAARAGEYERLASFCHKPHELRSPGTTESVAPGVSA